MNYIADDNRQSEVSQPKKKLTLAFEVYKSLINMLLLYMKGEEERYECGSYFENYINYFKTHRAYFNELKNFNTPPSERIIAFGSFKMFLWVFYTT